MIKLNNKGNASVILSIAITAILGFTAYAVDIGLAYVERVKLSNAIDSAVLASMLELPRSEVKAKTVAIEYLEKNSVNPQDTLIEVSTDKKSIRIEGTKDVKYFFAPVIGINSSNLQASSRGIIGPISSTKGGIRPFAVEYFDFSYGDIVTLKVGAGDGHKGNYRAVALGGKGSSVFQSNAIYGYSGRISVGDWIDTETGNMAGATNNIKNYINSETSTFNNFKRDTIRLWTIPLVDTLEVNGRSQVQVTGFGQFYVEDVYNKGGQIEIMGRFIRYVINGEIDIKLRDTGTYGAKLTK